MRVEPVSATNQDAALFYLSRSPYCNVFLSHVLLHDLPTLTRQNVVIAREHDAVRGVVYTGRQLVIAADQPAFQPVARHLEQRRGERMIVGERETVRAFWKLIRSWHARPRLVRDRQLVMMIDRERLQPYERRTTVRRARIDEWATVADGSAQMIRQEHEYDPRLGSPEFSAGVRQMIVRELWWVGIAENQLCFFCNIGPWCDRTVQLQGIWTPPSLRHRGLATASLAAICDRLLETSPTLSLYVNDFNQDAIALYRRVGFEHVADFQTLFF